MSQSESVASIAAALAKAQGEMTAPKKDRTAKIASDKGKYEYSYADLASVIDCVRQALSKNGLSFTQTTGITERGMALETKLLHSSGEWISSSYPLPAAGRPQEMGSALTYARRYSLCAMLGIAAEDDDDGNAAQQAKPAQQKAPPPVVVTEPPAEENEPPVVASPGPSAQPAAWKTYAKQLVEIAREAPDAAWFNAFEEANLPGIKAMQKVSEATYAWTQQRLAEILDQMRVPA
jgi:hypothetical protein